METENKVYKTAESGTCYHSETPDAVIEVLEQAKEERKRVRIWYGENGKSWNEENDVLGYIGRSTGTNKIPLLVHNRRSYGGGALLDHCIIKVVDLKTGKTLYKHENFKQALFTVEGVAVLQDGQPFAPQCKNQESAQRLCDFMNGKRNAK